MPLDIESTEFVASRAVDGDGERIVALATSRTRFAAHRESLLHVLLGLSFRVFLVHGKPTNPLASKERCLPRRYSFAFRGAADWCRRCDARSC